MTFRFIDRHRRRWPVAVMCDTLAVSPAGYYAWRHRPVSPRRQRRDDLTAQIRTVHAEVKARYGSPRVHAELVARGHGCCVNTVTWWPRSRNCRASASTTSSWPPTLGNAVSV